MNPYLLAVLAYVIGATPTSYWIGRGIYGVDLRERGSGNLGATNAFRVLGWRAAAPVMIVDVLKGWLPAFVFPGLDGETGWAWTLVYGGAAVVGHVFSFWVRFRGGKGVATSGGVFLALAPKAVMAALVAWLVVLGLTRIVSLASLAAALTIPLWLGFDPHPGGSIVLGFTVALALFVVWAHRSNIRRLVKGQEPRIGAPAPGGPP